MTIERFNRILDSNLQAQLRYEDRAAVSMYNLLDQARRELRARLTRHLERGNGYSASFSAAMIREIEAVMGQLRDGATGQIKDELTRAHERGFTGALAELRVFEEGINIAFASVNTNVLGLIVNEKTEFIQKTLEGVQRQMTAQIQRDIATANANRAARAAGQQTAVSDLLIADQARHDTTIIRDTLARGFAMGDSQPQMIKALCDPENGMLMRMTRVHATNVVRIGVNDTYNEGRMDTIRAAHEDLPHLGTAWVSALTDSTPICLALHGQKRELGQPFQAKGGTWLRPPAIGQPTKPAWHRCRSCVVPWSPRWPENPRLTQLTEDELKAYENGTAAPNRRLTPAAGSTNPTAAERAALQSRIDALKTRK